MSGKAAKSSPKAAAKTPAKKPRATKAAAKPRAGGSRAGTGRKGGKSTKPSAPGLSPIWLKLGDVALGLAMLGGAIWALMVFLGIR